MSRRSRAAIARATAPVLTAEKLPTLGELARRAEEHYGVPQDLEFAIEGTTIYLTQSRPITTLARTRAVDARRSKTHRAWTRRESRAARPARCACSSRRPTKSAMQVGEILVTRMTSPDWVPIMRRAAAIVTDAGGMTSHAAIVARELGLPCIVGTHDATRVLATGTVVTVDGAAGTM